MFEWDEDQAYAQPKNKFHLVNLRLYLLDYENEEYDTAFTYLQKQLSSGKEFLYPVLQFFVGDAYL